MCVRVVQNGTFSFFQFGALLGVDHSGRESTDFFSRFLKVRFLVAWVIVLFLKKVGGAVERKIGKWYKDTQSLCLRPLNILFYGREAHFWDYLSSKTNTFSENIDFFLSAQENGAKISLIVASLYHIIIIRSYS